MANWNFPNSPTVGQIYTFEDKSWKWDGVAWTLQSMSDTVVTYVEDSLEEMNQMLPYEGETPPTGTLKPGQMWLNTSDGRKYTWVVDADSAQWVEIDAALLVTDVTATEQLRNDLESDNGSEIIGYKRTEIDSVERNVFDKISETVSVKDFGAVGNAIADDTAAIQKAVDYAIANYATLYFPMGIYKVSGSGVSINGTISIVGAGSGYKSSTFPGGCVIRNDNGNCLTIAGSKIRVRNIVFMSTGGDTILQSDTVSQSTFEATDIIQRSNGYSCWNNGSQSYIDNRFRDCDLWHLNTATVPGFRLEAMGGLVNDNVWEMCRVNRSGNYFFNIESTTANFQFHNVFRDITFEVCNGGGIRLVSCLHYEISNCANWDAQVIGPVTKNFYSIEGNSNLMPSRGVIRNCGRWAGVNASGVYDISLPGNGLGGGTKIEGCFSAASTQPFAANLKNNRCIVHVVPGGLFTATGTDGSTIFDSSDLKVHGQISGMGSLLIGSETPIPGSPNNVFRCPDGGVLGTRNIDTLFSTPVEAGTFTIDINGTNNLGYVDVVIHGSWSTTNREGYAAYKVLFSRPTTNVTTIVVQAPTNAGGTFTTGFNFTASKVDVNTLRLTVTKGAGANFHVFLSGQANTISSVSTSFA